VEKGQPVHPLRRTAFFAVSPNNYYFSNLTCLIIFSTETLVLNTTATRIRLSARVHFQGEDDRVQQRATMHDPASQHIMHTAPASTALIRHAKKPVQTNGSTPAASSKATPAVYKMAMLMH
jgi:hypothetical protein